MNAATRWPLQPPSHVIPADSAAKVAEGQKVFVSAHGFPAWRYGYATGRITEKWTYIRNSVPQQPAGSLTAFAEIEQSPYPVLLGATVEVEIVTGRRKLLLPGKKVKP